MLASGDEVTLTILADENIPAADYFFGDLGQVRRVNGRQLDSARLADADALLVRSVTKVDKALLQGSRIRFVGTATSGFDHIDQDYLRSRAIGFAHAPGSNANSVVEYVLAAIAAVDDKLEQLLAGGSVGIIGYGVIGRAVATRLEALGIKHSAYDPWLDPSAIQRPGGLEQILACDVITLHAELTRESPWPSYHLLDADALQRIRSSALLINASRGAVVDNTALLDVLEKGRGPATVLDVWEGEPAINRALLQRIKLGTPHIAGYSLDGKVLATAMLCEAFCRHFELSPPHPGNPAGDLSPLHVNRPADAAQLLRQLMGQRYDISSDDAALRDTVLQVSEKEAAAGFDRLRKYYPERRELAGSQVVGLGKSRRERQLVKALGCTSRAVEPRS